MNSRHLAHLLRMWAAQLRATSQYTVPDLPLDVARELEALAAKLDKAPKRSLD